jgi:hypothetical protein
MIFFTLAPTVFVTLAPIENRLSGGAAQTRIPGYQERASRQLCEHRGRVRVT